MKTKKMRRFKKEDRPLEQTYRRLFREQVSTFWTKDKDSDFSLDQPSPVEFVPSVTTYGVLDPLTNR